MKMKMIVTAFLLTFAIPAIAQTDADLELAGTSVKKAVMIAEEDLTELRQIIRVWKQKCENKDSFCVIRECDSEVPTRKAKQQPRP